MLDRWLAHVETLGRAPTTLHEYRRMIEHDIRPALGAVALGNLTAYDLDAFYASALKRGLAPSSVRHFHAVISAALHQAERWEWIAPSPARRGASAPSVEQRDFSVPSPAERRDLIALAQARGRRRWPPRSPSPRWPAVAAASCARSGGTRNRARQESNASRRAPRWSNPP
ncbi:MAG TPA: hypothetical protein VMU14_05565 [Acidimicrobiales bacterium]|nr:hypothetical protein [Acidimicrobiales bacterium]